MNFNDKHTLWQVAQANPTNPNLSKSVHVDSVPGGQLNLTDAKIHRLAEVFAKICWADGYFIDIYRCPAYGF